MAALRSLPCDREVAHVAVQATRAKLSRDALEALEAIGKLADQFKADEIEALGFVVRVGVILARIEAGGSTT